MSRDDKYEYLAAADSKGKEKEVSACIIAYFSSWLSILLSTGFLKMISIRLSVKDTNRWVSCAPSYPVRCLVLYQKSPWTRSCQNNYACAADGNKHFQYRFLTSDDLGGQIWPYTIPHLDGYFGVGPFSNFLIFFLFGNSWSTVTFGTWHLIHPRPADKQYSKLCVDCRSN